MAHQRGDMVDLTIRHAYARWPEQHQRLRDRVATLTDADLALRPSSDRWPVWASIGHLACQRVFWLCDFAGEPGAESTRFTNAGFDCPGDDDLVNVLSAADLVEALDSTFAIIERVLDTWTVRVLDEVITQPAWGDNRAHSRGWVINGTYGHDVWHTAELNETLGRHGLPLIDFWG